MELKKELRFKLEDVEGEFKVIYSPFSLKVYHHDMELKRKGRKGYEVTTVDGQKEFFRITADITFSHIVEFRGEKTMLEEKLSTLEYIIGGIPLLLVFAGGLFGALFGVIAVTFNYNFMRQHDSIGSKISVALVTTVIAFILYFIAALLFTGLMQLGKE